MPTILAASLRLFYDSPRALEVPTPGARVLFLHGEGVDHHLFEEQLRFFAAASTPIALDLPGHGRSEGEARDEAGAYREAVKGFVEALRLRPVVLCGHALGGAIALDYAAHYPQDMEGLVLVSMGITFPQAARVKDELARSPGGYPEQYSRLGLSERASEAAAQKLAAVRRQASLPSALRDLTAAARWNAAPRMAVLDTPTLVLFGEEDPLLGQAGAILGAIPHAFFDTIPLARGFPHLEMPDIFNDALNSFLAIVPDLALPSGGEGSRELAAGQGGFEQPAP